LDFYGKTESRFKYIIRKEVQINQFDNSSKTTFSDERRNSKIFSIGGKYGLKKYVYSVEITYGINSVISKLMTFAENAETGQFLFLIMLILSYFTCS
jgi:hypothetical protein